MPAGKYSAAGVNNQPPTTARVDNPITTATRAATLRVRNEISEETNTANTHGFSPPDSIALEARKNLEPNGGMTRTATINENPTAEEIAIAMSRNDPEKA